MKFWWVQGNLFMIYTGPLFLVDFEDPALQAKLHVIRKSSILGVVIGLSFLCLQLPQNGSGNMLSGRRGPALTVMVDPQQLSHQAASSILH